MSSPLRATWRALRHPTALAAVWLEFDRANERAYIENPARVRRVFWRAVATTLTYLAVAMYVSFNLRGLFPLNALVGGILGASAARVGLATMRRAWAFRWGWLAGRSAMVASLGEAARRGMTIDEWVQSQWETDERLF